MNYSDFMNFFSVARESFEKNLDYLSELDSVLGDGDHGISMLKGIRSAEEATKDKTFAGVSELLSTAGRALMKETGGSCGPLFATLFIQASMAAKGKDNLSTEDFAVIMEKSSLSISNLGKAHQGEKTMLDALIPAAESLRNSADNDLCTKEALKRSAEAAKNGAENTKNMLATKGRGRYQGEKSIGHIDPGAMSVCLIMEALYSACRDGVADT